MIGNNIDSNGRRFLDPDEDFISNIDEDFGKGSIDEDNTILGSLLLRQGFVNDVNWGEDLLLN